MDPRMAFPNEFAAHVEKYSASRAGSTTCSKVYEPSGVSDTARTTSE